MGIEEAYNHIFTVTEDGGMFIGERYSQYGPIEWTVNDEAIELIKQLKKKGLVKYIEKPVLRRVKGSNYGGGSRRGVFEIRVVATTAREIVNGTV